MQKLKLPWTGHQANGSGKRTVRSEDGSLVFTLSRTPSGLYVERNRLLNDGKRVVHSVVFDDSSSFEHWCDNEPQRFEFPLLYTLLRRNGNELLDG